MSDPAAIAESPQVRRALKWWKLNDLSPIPDPYFYVLTDAGLIEMTDEEFAGCSIHDLTPLGRQVAEHLEKPK